MFKFKDRVALGVVAGLCGKLGDPSLFDVKPQNNYL